MRPYRLALVLLLTCAAGCDEPKETASSSSASAAMPAASASAAPTAAPGNVDKLTEPKARDALRKAGYKGGRGSTGPDEGAFDLSWRKESGERVKVAVHVFDTEFKKKHSKPRVKLDGAHVEHGDKLLVVEVKKDDAIDKAASKEILDALLKRAANTDEPIAVIELPKTSWLLPSTEVVEKKLVIAPKLVETATKALEGEGYKDVRLRTAQSVDTTNEKDTGHPGHEIMGKKDDGEEARVGFRCVREDTNKQFWPEPHEADLGEAIAVVERCKVVVSVRVKDAKDADPARSKALFGKLLAFKQ